MKDEVTKLITPPWAQAITVKEQDDTLVITGWGRSVGMPVDVREIDRNHRKEADLLWRLRQHSVGKVGKRRQSDGPGLYQFADAKSDDKLIAFCEEFGPFWGEVRSIQEQDEGLWTVTVAQPMQSLRDARDIFSATVRLLQLLNSQDELDRSSIRQLLFSFPPASEIPAMMYHWQSLEIRHSKSIAGGASVDILELAHWVMCHLLTPYPPRLVHHEGKVYELPPTDDEGIRSAMYYALRRDYMAGRHIGTCLRCGSHFPVKKHGTRGCSPECRTALRNAKYYDLNKKELNAARRQPLKRGE